VDVAQQYFIFLFELRATDTFAAECRAEAGAKTMTVFLFRSGLFSIERKKLAWFFQATDEATAHLFS